MSLLTDADREALIDALRANRNNPSGRHLRLLAVAERIVARHRAEALGEAANSIAAIGVPEYYDAPQYREGLVDGYGLSANHCDALAYQIENGADDA